MGPVSRRVLGPQHHADGLLGQSDGGPCHQATRGHHHPLGSADQGVGYNVPLQVHGPGQVGVEGARSGVQGWNGYDDGGIVHVGAVPQVDIVEPDLSGPGQDASERDRDRTIGHLEGWVPELGPCIMVLGGAHLHLLDHLPG